MSDNYQLSKGSLLKVAIYQCATKIETNRIGLHIDDIGFDLDLIVSEMDKLTNVDLYKIFKTDEVTNVALTCVITQGIVFLLNTSDTKAQSLMRQPLKIISKRISTLLEDDAITRLRVLE